MNARRRRRCSPGTARLAACSVLLPLVVVAAPAGASGSTQAPPQVPPVAILADHAVTIDRDTTVRGGAVVVRVAATPDGPAGSGQVVLRRGARVEGPDGAADFAGQRRVSSFCLYSVDYTPRDDDVLLVNGVPLTLEHNRYWADYEGRVFRSFNGRWRTADTSCFHLPDGTVVDGVNTFQLRLQGSIFAYAAFIISHKPNVEPDPGGDPDPDPCANGCAT